MKVGIFYGSSTGNTASVAQQISDKLASLGEVELKNISDTQVSEFSDYDLLVLGASTWGIGEIQDDWVGKDSISGVELAGKKVAVFGTGDQSGFGDSFVDAIGILADAAVAAGAELVGKWPVAGYEHSNSVAERDGIFVGLPIDEDQQADLTDQRIADWTAQVIKEVQ